MSFRRLSQKWEELNSKHLRSNFYAVYLDLIAKSGRHKNLMQEFSIRTPCNTTLHTREQSSWREEQWRRKSLWIARQLGRRKKKIQNGLSVDHYTNWVSGCTFPPYTELLAYYYSNRPRNVSCRQASWGQRKSLRTDKRNLRRRCKTVYLPE